MGLKPSPVRINQHPSALLLAKLFNFGHRINSISAWIAEIGEISQSCKEVRLRPFLVLAILSV